MDVIELNLIVCVNFIAREHVRETICNSGKVHVRLPHIIFLEKKVVKFNRVKNSREEEKENWENG